DDPVGALLAAEARQRYLGPAQGPTTAARPPEFRASQFGAARARKGDLLGEDGAHRIGCAAVSADPFTSAAESRSNSDLPRSKGPPGADSDGCYREIGDTRPHRART